jgi:arylsulfatase A-like enzyme
MGVLATFPIVRFFVTDWKWERSAGAEASTQAHDRPNVLLISIDTLRADHLGCYGDRHGLTPHLDRLAAQGALFEHAITSSPWTLPAMASLFTGLSPSRHGAGEITNRRDPLGRSPLPPNTWTLTSALNEAGYRTHAIVTNPYLALRYGFGAGFETYENVTIESEAFLSFEKTTAVRLLKWLKPEWITGDRGETVSKRAQNWLASYDRSRPFFLWLHYVDPHPPYSRPGVIPHKSFRGDVLSGATDDGTTSIALRSPDVARLRSGEIRLGDKEKEAVRDLYRAEVAAVDSAVGKVFDQIDELGLKEETLVVLIADHGEEFWEHGRVEHGHTVYDELLRVPFIMRWPGHLATGRRVEEQVRIVDVAPTVLDLLGLPVPPGLDGESVLPILQEKETAPRIAFAENMLFAEERIGIRTQEHKYVRWADGREEVYDLASDPAERVNLVAVISTTEPLRELYAAAAPKLGDGRRSLTAKPAPELDPRTEHALRALGYVQ